MAYLNHLGGLRKEFGHVKVGNDQDSKYEPALYIINETSPRFKDQSFIIPLSCLWKYCEPWWTADADQLDLDEMNEITKEILMERRILQTGLSYQGKYQDNDRKMAALLFSEALNKSNRIMRMTGYGLAICMQMFDIPCNPQAAAQLLLFIQNGLDQLKNMDMHIPESEFQIGEAKLFDGGKPIGKAPFMLTESDLYVDAESSDRSVNQRRP